MQRRTLSRARRAAHDPSATVEGVIGDPQQMGPWIERFQSTRDGNAVRPGGLRVQAAPASHDCAPCDAGKRRLPLAILLRLAFLQDGGALLRVALPFALFLNPSWAAAR